MTPILKFCDSGEDTELSIKARGWLGVPFRHQGRSRYGVDCLGLLVKLAEELQLTSRENNAFWSEDRTDYGHYPNALELLSETDSIVPGVVLLLEVDRRATHLGIASKYSQGGMGLIHAYAPARKVIEEPLSSYWLGRVVSAFSLS